MKWGILTIFVLFLLILVSGCGITGRHSVDLSKCDSTADGLDKDNCLIDLGVAAKNVDVCREINDEALNKECINRVAIVKKDVSLCGGDWCLAQVAEARQDEKICEKVESEDYWYGICYKHVAEAKQDENLCMKLSNEAHQLDCITNVAVAKHDVKICEPIVGILDEDNCLIAVAYEYNDENACKKIHHNVNRNICFSKVAHAKEDVSICELISIDIIKEGCLRDLG